MRKIAAQYLFPANSAEPLKNGLLVLDDSGKILEIRRMQQEEESTEFYNGILVPGFVNSHCHIELSHLKGAFEKGTGMAGFIRQINSLRNSVDRDGRVSTIEQELRQMYDSGVSAMADISNCDESFLPKSQSDIYTRTFLEVFGTEEKDVGHIMENVMALHQKAIQTGIDSSPTPHSCYTMSPQLLEAVAAESLKSGWLSYHNQESWEEEELLKNGEGPLADEYKSRSLSTPPICGKPSLFYFLERLKATGLLSGQNILLVHNTFSDYASISEAKKEIANLYMALCPLSNLFIHNSLPPVRLLMEEGVDITLGTDSLSSNDVLSMVQEIKCLHSYFPDIPLAQIIEWSTMNGAKFLGVQERLGSFEPGKSPGVVLIDNIDWDKMKLTDSSKSVRLV
jgi:cytosine/adenosine deaminase-related metal-dependent hydrolase